METWVLLDEVCPFAGLSVSQLALQGVSCHAIIEGRAWVDVGQIQVLLIRGGIKIG